MLDFNIWCIGPACLELVFHRLPSRGELLAGVNFSTGQEWTGKGSPRTQSKAWNCSVYVTHPCRETGLQPSGATDKHGEPVHRWHGRRRGEEQIIAWISHHEVFAGL